MFINFVVRFKYILAFFFAADTFFSCIVGLPGMLQLFLVLGVGISGKCSAPVCIKFK